MGELTLVTAFFDLGRGKWKGYERGNSKYLQYFAHWATIRNNLIVYTEPQYADEIMKIRKEFGREKQTKIVCIEDIYSYDKEIYDKIKNVMKNKYTWYFRYRLKTPECWNYKYNYIMALKSHFVIDAMKCGWAEGDIAWIDFGFDHGGDNFRVEKEFDFLWKYDFSHHIHIGQERELDDRPIFNIVRNLTVYLRGNVIIAHDNLWVTFHKLLREAVLNLAACGLADDDQTLMLMAYRAKPELFKLHPWKTWGGMMSEFGGEPHTVIVPKQRNFQTFGKRCKRRIHQWWVEFDIRHRKGAEINEKYYKDQIIYWNNHDY